MSSQLLSRTCFVLFDNDLGNYMGLPDLSFTDSLYWSTDWLIVGRYVGLHLIGIYGFAAFLPILTQESLFPHGLWYQEY